VAPVPIASQKKKGKKKQGNSISASKFKHEKIIILCSETSSFYQKLTDMLCRHVVPSSFM
jgi:hypothetical protein